MGFWVRLLSGLLFCSVCFALSPQEVERELREVRVTLEGNLSLEEALELLEEQTDLSFQLWGKAPEETKKVQLRSVRAGEALRQLLAHFDWAYYILPDGTVEVYPRKNAKGAAERLCRHGFFWMEEGKLKGAERLFVQALTLHPKLEKARWGLFQVLFYRGKAASGLAHLRSLKDSRVVPEGTYPFWLARTLYRVGRTSQALDVLKSCQKKGQLASLEAAFWEGKICWELGLWERARKAFSKVIDLYEDLEKADGKVYALTAGACYYLRRWEDLEAATRWALEEDSTNFWALYYRAKGYSERGKWAKGLSLWKQAWELYPYRWEIGLGLVESLYRTGRTEEGKKVWQSLQEEFHQPELLVWKAQQAWEKGRIQLCLQLSERALAKGPRLWSAQAYQYLALKSLQRPQAKGVLTRLLRGGGKQEKWKLLKKWERQGEAWLSYRGVQFLERGEYAKGEEEFARIFQKHPTNLSVLYHWLYSAFWQGKYKLCEKLATELLRKEPRHWWGWYYLLETLFRQGRIAAVEKALQKAEEQKLSHPLFSYVRGRFWELRESFARAREYYRRAVERGSSEPLVLWVGAQALLKLNDPHGANDLFFEAKKYSPPPEVYIDHARLYVVKYDHSYARKLLEKVRPKNHPLALALKARSWLEDFFAGARRYQRTAELIEQALKIHPTLEEAKLLQAMLYFRARHFQKAVEVAKKVLEKNPYCLEAYAFEAFLAIFLGDQKRLHQLERHIRSLVPAPYSFYTLLADLLEDHFLYREAVAYAQKANRLHPIGWEAKTILGVNLFRLGKIPEARKVLEQAYRLDKFNLFVVNSLSLLDKLKKGFQVYSVAPNVWVRIPPQEARVLLPYIRQVVQRAREDFRRRYHFEWDFPVWIEFYPRHDDFSVRVLGIPRVGALGVCFGPVVALNSPKALPNYLWGRTLWHELAHVATVSQTKHRIPRWFTEGLSVYEETKFSQLWERESERLFLRAWRQGRLRSILDLNQGFYRPRYGGEVLVCYFHAGLVCAFLERQWGWKVIPQMLEAYRQAKSTKWVLRHILKIEPREFDRRFLEYLKGRFVQQGDPPLGSRELARWQRAVEKHPQSARAWARLGLNYVWQGNLVDGEIAADQAHRLAPEHGDVLALRGFLALRQGSAERGIPLLEKALRQKTSFPQLCRRLLVSAYWRQKKLTQAEKHLQVLIQMAPRDAKLWQRLLQLYLSRKDREKVLQVRRKLARLQPSNWQNLWHLFQEAFRQKQYREALQWGEALIWIVPYRVELHQQLAKCYEELQLWEKALRELEILLHLYGKRKPKEASRVWTRMGRIYQRQKKRERAREAWRKALALDPTNREAKALLEELSSQKRP